MFSLFLTQLTRKAAKSRGKKLTMKICKKDIMGMSICATVSDVVTVPNHGSVTACTGLCMLRTVFLTATSPYQCTIMAEYVTIMK